LTNIDKKSWDSSKNKTKQKDILKILSLQMLEKKLQISQCKLALVNLLLGNNPAMD